MFQAQLIFTEMLSKKIAPVLKTQGFIRKKQTFHFQFEQNWGLINFQKSTMSTKEKVIFTVNAGIVSERLLKFFSGTGQGIEPDLRDTQWNVRLGKLINENKDIWWTIDQETNTEELTKFILKNLVEVVIPEIMKYIRDNSLRDLWLSGQSPSLTEFQRLLFLMVLLKQIGPQELLESTIKELRRISENKPSAITAKVYIDKINKA